MALVPGTRLGVYEVTSPIGEGGMGQVWRARDTKLDRDVALKVLPESFARDSDRVMRFTREAKTLASLNHPNIAAIYGLEESSGQTAIVMELVAGDDLSQRLLRGAIPLDEALPIARQIAEALEAAHGQGIIHRDLKPANIKLRPDGTVKVLDFGLAKALVSDGDRQDLADSPTVTAVGTRAGIILGTALYMSPEQAKGRPVDRRADLWAFGVVLFELLTGTRPFQGESVSETLSHVLTQAPDWSRLPVSTPPSIRTLLRRCLEKNPAKRLDSAAALRLEIDDALGAPAGVTPVSATPARRRQFSPLAMVAVIAAGVVGALGTWALTRSEPATPDLPVRFDIKFPLTDPLEMGPPGRHVAISPDGRYLAYLSRGRLMVRALDQLEAVNVSSATGVPFFKPDSQWIGFFDNGDLKKVAVTGQPVVTLCRNLRTFQGGSWGDDGTIVIANMDGAIGLRKVPENGGDATSLTNTGETKPLHISPSMLPGGRGVLFTIFTNSLDRHVAVLDLKSGQVKKLLVGAAAEYLATGHLLYVTSSQQANQPWIGTLWRVGFDLERLEVRGQAERVSETLQVDVMDGVNFATSKTGTLAYVPPRVAAWSFVWVDRTTGRETAINMPARLYQTVALSPDDKRVAFATADREFDIWTWDFEREFETRVTSSPRNDLLPRWTPDGRQIIFTSRLGGLTSIYSTAADGSGTPVRLTDSSKEQYPNSIRQQDQTLLFAENRPNTGLDILRRPLTAAQTAAGVDLVSSPSHEYAANISPDGRYFAYVSIAPDRPPNVYVRSYLDAGSPAVSISTAGGAGPVWSRGSKELFYLDASNTLMAVSVSTSGPQFTFRKPVRVFETKYSGGNFYSYDVTKDGRFLMLKEAIDADLSRARIVVVLNWFEELKKLAPAK